VKLYEGSSHNVVFLVDQKDGSLAPFAEVALLFSSPKYEYTKGGQVDRQRQIGECRFVSSVELLRKMADHLTDIADDLENIDNERGNQ